MTLPPFSGDTPTCIKCGNVGAYTTHRKHGTTLAVTPEHLERRCSRCDFEWPEATIEQTPPRPADNLADRPEPPDFGGDPT